MSKEPKGSNAYEKSSCDVVTLFKCFWGGITAPEMYVCGKKFSVMHMRGSAPAKNSAQAKRGSLFAGRVPAYAYC